MSISKEKVQEVITEFGGTENNSGSTEAQVALLTARISHLTEHLKENKHDHSSRRGLLKMVGQRKRMLTYLKNNDIEKYRELIQKLGLRK